MSAFQDFLYGAIQGVTELLPISSSGHLILISDLFDHEPTMLTLTSLHLASALALIIVYKNQIVQKIKQKDITYLKNLIIASIPVVLIGIIFGDKIDEFFYNSTFIALNLILWGIVMMITENSVIKINDNVSFKKSIFIGLMQILSLLPGTSRSGITTLAGMWQGYSKEFALSFTFIMGIALLMGTFSFEVIKDLAQFKLSSINFIAFFSAFIFSLLAGSLIKRYSKEKLFTVSGIYRIILGITILILL